MSIDNGNLELKRKAWTGLKWNYTGMAARSLSRLLLGIVLARMLGPKPFGQVAIAMLAISLGNLLADLGFSAAVVQKVDLVEADIRGAFSAQLLIGVLMALLTVGAAGPVARMFRTPEAASILTVLALNFPLQTLGQTAGALLRRRLQFRPIQTAQVSSYVVGYLGFGIPLAYFGYGVWALVAAQLVQTLVNSALLFGFAPHPIMPVLRWQGAVDMCRFGANVVGTNLVNWAILNMDNAVVGRAFGVVSLGLYSRAYNLATTPFGFVAGLQQVLFPVSSRAQDDNSVLRRVYLGCIALIAACMIPGFAIVAAVAHTVIVGLYGAKWAGAAGMLGVLALAMPLYAFVGIAGPLMWGIGKVHYELRAEAITVAVAVPLYALAATYSATAVAWAVVLTYMVRFILMTNAVVRLLAIRWRDVLATFRGPLVIAAAMALLARSVDLILGRAGMPPSLQLAGVLFAALIAALLFMFSTPALFFGAAGLSVLQSLRASLPSVINRYLTRVDAA